MRSGAGHHFLTVSGAGVEAIEVLVEVYEVTGCAHIENAAVQGDVGDGCALEVQLLAGEQRACWCGTAIGEKTVAGWVDGSIRVEGRSARSVPDGREIDSQADGRAVGEVIVEPGELPAGVALVARDELVEADAGAANGFQSMPASKHP